jgi:hypothetical protein
MNRFLMALFVGFVGATSATAAPASADSEDRFAPKSYYRAQSARDPFWRVGYMGRVETVRRTASDAPILQGLLREGGRQSAIINGTVCALHEPTLIPMGNAEVEITVTAIEQEKVTVRMGDKTVTLTLRP